MAFILDIGFASPQRYLSDYLISFFEEQNVSVVIEQDGGRITITADEETPGLEAALEALNTQMPYSLFMKGVSHRFCDMPLPPAPEAPLSPLPVSLGVCDRCKSEMFEPSNRRYYYPFTSCRHCGPQYAFFEYYPYVRANTALRDVRPCTACEAEKTSNPFRREYVQIGCHACGIAVRLEYGAEQIEASDAEDFKTLFERAAKLIAEGKSVLVKSGFGWRLFSPLRDADVTSGSFVMQVNSRTLMDAFALTKQEIESLYSLEKPLLKVATLSDGMRGLFGTAALCKVPDEGFSVLLCEELEVLGVEAVLCRPCDESASCDARITHALVQQSQSEMHLFVNGENRFIASGERVSFPALVDAPSRTLCVTPTLVAVPTERGHLLDRMACFEGATATRMTLLEGTQTDLTHSDTHTFSVAEGAFMSAFATLGLDEPALGVCFEADAVNFLYHNGRTLSTVIPPIVFEPELAKEKVATLREGTDRLMERITKDDGLSGILESIKKEQWSLFDAASAIIGTEGRGFEALDNAALEFMGKGGTQVETHFESRRFHPYAMLASLLSYRLAGVEPVMLSFSLFESLADYMAETLSELQAKTGAKPLIFCGSRIAQASLQGRVHEKLKAHPPLFNPAFPVGEEGAVVGGIYL